MKGAAAWTQKPGLLTDSAMVAVLEWPIIEEQSTLAYYLTANQEGWTGSWTYDDEEEELAEGCADWPLALVERSLHGLKLDPLVTALELASLRDLTLRYARRLDKAVVRLERDDQYDWMSAVSQFAKRLAAESRRLEPKTRRN